MRSGTSITSYIFVARSQHDPVEVTSGGHRLRTSLPVLTTGTVSYTAPCHPRTVSPGSGRVFGFSKSNLCRCPLVEDEQARLLEISKVPFRLFDRPPAVLEDSS